MRSRARLLIALAVLGAVGLIALQTMSPSPAPDATEAIPANAASVLFAAAFPDAGGQLQTLRQWRGKVLVLNFWASWCAPCREEMPELSALQAKYRARGLVVLGVSTDEAAKVQQFARETPVDYPLLAGDFEAMGLAANLGNSQGILPYTLVMRRDGSIAARYFGRLNIQALERTLQPLLSTPS